jgi:hypothetical protein
LLEPEPARLADAMIGHGPLLTVLTQPTRCHQPHHPAPKFALICSIQVYATLVRNTRRRVNP